MIGSLMPDDPALATAPEDPARLAPTPRRDEPPSANISRRAWTVGATSACLSEYILTAREKLVDLSISSMTF
jgi:hypothetical protein